MWISMRGRVTSGAALGVFDKNRPFWMILQCPKNIMWFYIDQINRAYADGLIDAPVQAPLALSHVSVVRKEKALKGPWKGLQGSWVDFEYQPKVMTNGRHWWLPVRSNRLIQLREKMGLRGKPYVPFHLTVACTSEVVEPKKVRAPKEVIARLALLENMRKVVPGELWSSCPEAEEMRTLKERFSTEG